MPKCFFHLIGRMGNLLFIYCHARAYCEQHGYELCLPPWVGEKIFDIPHANRTPGDKCDIVMPEDTHQRQSSLIYTRKQVREWLRIRPEVLEQLKPVLENRKTVLINLRHGKDYSEAGLVTVPLDHYLDAAMGFGYGKSDYEFEVDTKPTQLPYFQGDISASGLNTTWVALPSFYRLMTTQVLFRANSTFSWWAATLGNSKVYSPVIKGLTGFVEGNWPVMADIPPNTDLHLKDE